MTFACTQNNINAAFGGLAFQPTTGFAGAASLQITTNDQGFNGAGGALSEEERDELVADLMNGAKTRAQVLRAVAEHAAVARRESNRAFVLMQYFGYLRRNPDDAPEQNRDFAGYNFWLSKLDEFNGDFLRAEMVKAFLTAEEYRRRFGQ